MYPYFERDMSAGRLTLDAAQEMVDCLWMKFNERARFLPLVYRHGPCRIAEIPLQPADCLGAILERLTAGAF